MAEEEAALMEVCILGDEHKTVLRCMVPDGFLRGFAQADVSYVD